MVRGLILAAFLSVLPQTAPTPATSALRIEVTLRDADGNVTPLPRHALLISDNPSTAPPRRVVTSANGTVDVRLPPGNYTIESDRPVTLAGKAYQWTQMLDIVAGRDDVLRLNAENAEIESIDTAIPTENTEASSSARLLPWQDALVAIWSPTAHATGLVIDASGLIMTSQRAIGAATSVEVQLTPTVKVAGRVVATDDVRDVAVVKVHPSTMASMRPMSLGCPQVTAPPPVGQEIVALEAPLRDQKGTMLGTVSRVGPSVIDSDLALGTGGAGGPAFNARGEIIGITSVVEEEAGRRRTHARVIRMSEVCAAIANAEKKAKDVQPPTADRLLVEPTRPFPVDALKDVAQRRAGSVNPYAVTAADFEVAFLTPLQVFAMEDRDFGAWSEYVEDMPPVLLVRVTPKMVEGFWTKIARGAAYTQGVALPPMKRLKTGFARMRALCGETEVTPIHPFIVERRVSQTDAIDAGLYVFDPGALAPSCAKVTLMLYSEKEPSTPDTITVDAAIVKQIWEDFAPYRALK